MTTLVASAIYMHYDFECTHYQQLAFIAAICSETRLTLVEILLALKRRAVRLKYFSEKDLLMVRCTQKIVFAGSANREK